MEKTTQKEKGITLIALIITIIVMLILVGVTINVALNGGLFDSADYAATETKKEAEKEQLLSAVVGAIGTDGKVDSTKISLPEGFTKDESKSTETKLVVKGKEGIYWEVNLNTAAIKQYDESGAITYTFTIGELGDRGLLNSDSSDPNVISFSEFWGDGVSEKLKNSTIKKVIDGEEYATYNITCSDPRYVNLFDTDGSPGCPLFGLAVYGDNIVLTIVDVSDASSIVINNGNYKNYANISFTISMAE